MLGDREHNITTTAAAAKFDSYTLKENVCLSRKNFVCVRDGVRQCICTFIHGHLAARFTGKRLTDLE